MAANKANGNDKKDLRSLTAVEIGYFSRTGRPVYALIFLLPFIVLYETLVLLVNPQLLTEPVSNIRGAVVSFVWVQNFLLYIGMNTKNAWLFAPVVVALTLLLIQIISRESWKIRAGDFLIMAVECLVLAMPLIVLALVLNRSANVPANSMAPQYDIADHSISMDILTGIGAGIYEELIFRLLLISLSLVFFETVLGVSRFKAVVISVIISSVLFSLHHHFVFINGQFAKAEIFTLPRFAFRTIAGVFFAIIFAARGFGIAAGTHSFYDIIATLLNAWLFEQH